MLIKCTIAIVIFATIQCVRLVPDRANVTWFNESFMHDARIWISRLSRKSPYFMNIEANITHTWGNNVTVHFVFYEFLNNQYRRSFMELHPHFCDMFWNYPVLGIGTMFAQRGVACPASPGFYGLYNLTLPMPNFHYHMPFTKFKLEVELTADTNHSMTTYYIYGSFIEDRKKIKN